MQDKARETDKVWILEGSWLNEKESESQTNCDGKQLKEFKEECDMISHWKKKSFWLYVRNEL